jgi:hypothetical protein
MIAALRHPERLRLRRQPERAGPGMPPLIAMRAAISSDAARAFAQGFYAAIAAGHDVRAAYAAGCDRMRLLGVGDADVPVLLER